MKKLFSCALAATFALLGPTAPAKAGPNPYLGEVMIAGFNFCPRGWAFAAGQILPINENQSLYSLLGTTYGGDGRTTFGLPDMRGRHSISDGRSPGLSVVTWGEKRGVETTVESTATMANHTHAILGSFQGKTAGSANPPTKNDPTDSYFATFPAGQVYSSTQGTPTPMGASTDRVTPRATLGNTGGGRTQNNMQPYLGLTFCVALQGVFPPRN